MADDEDAEPLPEYVYEGPREGGATVEIGVPPKTAPVELLGQRSASGGLTGKATFPNGDVYIGGYLGGSRQYQGAYTYSGGKPAEEGDEAPPALGTYEGAWKKGVKDGLGVMTFKDGSKYHGNYKKGLREGQGSFFYANGDIYAGEWVAGKKHGIGTYFYKASGAKVAGTWTEGVMGKGVFTDKHGGVYEGTFAGDATTVAYGEGKFVSPAGAVAVV